MLAKKNGFSQPKPHKFSCHDHECCSSGKKDFVSDVLISTAVTAGILCVTLPIVYRRLLARLEDEIDDLEGPPGPMGPPGSTGARGSQVTQETPVLPVTLVLQVPPVQQEQQEPLVPQV